MRRRGMDPNGSLDVRVAPESQCRQGLDDARVVTVGKKKSSVDARHRPICQLLQAVTSASGHLLKAKRGRERCSCRCPSISSHQRTHQPRNETPPEKSPFFDHTSAIPSSFIFACSYFPQVDLPYDTYIHNGLPTAEHWHQGHRNLRPQPGTY